MELLWSSGVRHRNAPPATSSTPLSQTVPSAHGYGLEDTKAGFDAVHIYDTDKIRFAQVTAEKSHDFLLCSIRSLPERLAVQYIDFTRVDVVVVRPLDDSRDFSKGTVTGRLDQGWRDFF
jgi:hypothetical protein